MNYPAPRGGVSLRASSFGNFHPRRKRRGILAAEIKIMDFEEVVRKRQSIRRFEEKEIPEEKIRNILELANLSPSAGNLQARKVFLIKDKETKERITSGRDFISEAGVVLVVCADQNESAEYGEWGRELYSIQDATIFTSYLQLAATSLGLASCWVGAFDEEEIKRILNIPEGLKPIAILPIGYPAEKPTRTPRKKLEDIVLDKNRFI